MKRRYIVLSLIPLFCGACDQPVDSTKQEHLKNLEHEVTDLKTRVDKLDGETTRLQSELDAEKARYSSVIFDPSSKGYQRLNTTSGSFLVSLKDVQPYADGYNLKLAIGNLSSAEYSGFILTAKWNKSFDKFTPEDWGKLQKEKTFNYTEKLLSGSWNTVSLILSPAQKEELGYIEISMATDQVMLISH